MKNIDKNYVKDDKITKTNGLDDSAMLKFGLSHEEYILIKQYYKKNKVRKYKSNVS